MHYSANTLPLHDLRLGLTTFSTQLNSAMSEATAHFDHPLQHSGGIIRHANRYHVSAKGHHLHANFEYPSSSRDGRPHPLVIAFHGGGLVTGSGDCEFLFPDIKSESRAIPFVIAERLTDPPPPSRLPEGCRLCCLQA